MLNSTGRSTLDLRYLDPDDLHVFRGADGRVYATINDELTLISPIFVRTHPLTDPDRYLSLHGSIPNPNAEVRGDEFGLLRNWQRLDHQAQQLVEENLARRYLHPRVLQILSVQDYGGVHVCEFETNRGRREVTLRDTRQRHLPGRESRAAYRRGGEPI